MSQNDNPFGALKKLVDAGSIRTKAYVPASGGKKPSAAALRYADASVRKAFEEENRAAKPAAPSAVKPAAPAAKPASKPSAPAAAAAPKPAVRTPAPRRPAPRAEEAKPVREKPGQKASESARTPRQIAPKTKTAAPAPKERMNTRPEARDTTPEKRAERSRRTLAKVLRAEDRRAPEDAKRELMPVAQQTRSPFVPPNPITKPVTPVPGLPVSEHGDELAAAIRDNPVIVVCGETGSGKTTQLPKICLMAGRGTKGLIGHTQPRRIAASSIAKRIAAEMQSEVGEIVGYKVRFTDKTMPGAAIKLMTDGILLAETQTDPLLKRYDTIIIDEAHERSINIDFLLGYLKRVLAKRRDLRVIVTSATIDAERFAKHFAIDGKPAPVFTISGRTYPVEIRWRPVDDTDETDDKTLMEAVADACEELEMAGRGDILVFLPGEREIREAAEVLRGRHRPGMVEILPLYARLSAQEQERVFKSGGARRIVLATNVAETSITVPGIRYVVDTGLARIKRYSYRNKVEQLLVEPVSKASANQRAGRCGRVADGICIRLYDENDWARRPDFTDPEIVRSNLAAVILRMKALRLGDVRSFDFVEPPPPKAIADGYAILSELHAIDRVGDLTDVGRTLSRLPVDPKLSRMLLEASRRGALKEALVIVSGLAVQDPRERPLPAQQQADQAHKRFADESSDFLSYLNIWNWFEAEREAKTSNRELTEKMHRNFISPRRMREWRDVWRQLKELTEEIGWTMTQAPADYESLHASLLTGLLGNLGMRDLSADLRAAPYLGARGIRFWVWPGSALAKKAGKWVMAAELVETSRLFARCVADIEPEWIERAAQHLIKKSWSEPHWEKTRAEVVALERGTLYGLAVYSDRRVQFAPHDPAAARDIFIRQALVEEQYDTRAPFFAHNRRLIREIEEIENKTRRPDVLVDDETIYAFYDKILDKSVVGGSTFEKWRRTAEKENPKILFMKRDDLMRRDASGVTAEWYPKIYRAAGIEMALTYHFEPGAVRDGVTLAVPIFALNQIDAVRCEWLVPGMLKEKVRGLIKSLPQKLRRHCVPIDKYAEGFFERTQGVQVQSKTLVDALIADIREETGTVCERTDFKPEMLPAHLFMNFKVLDEHGRQIGMGRNLAELRAEFGEKAQETFRNVAQADASVSADLADNITNWTFGELPELMEIKRGGLTLIGHPALVDKGESCTLDVFDDLDQARKAHRAGLRRLFLLQLREQVRYLQKSLSPLQRVQMQCAVIAPIAKTFESFEQLRDELTGAAVETAAMQGEWPVNEIEFQKRKDEARSRLTLIGGEYLRLMETVASELSGLNKRLQSARAFTEAVKDIENQLRGLFVPHFLLMVPFERLKHYPRYIKAVNVRLERLRNDPQRDASHAAEIAKFSAALGRELAARKGETDERLENFRWMLEELRVSLFAQELRTPVPVSVKRLTKQWEALRRL